MGRARGQGDGSYLAFLLLRLRVISLTQAGWFITRLKPDFGGKGNINGVMCPPVPTQGCSGTLGHPYATSPPDMRLSEDISE